MIMPSKRTLLTVALLSLCALQVSAALASEEKESLVVSVSIMDTSRASVTEGRGITSNQKFKHVSKPLVLYIYYYLYSCQL